MIKNYNQYINESILDELKGPSEDEVWNKIKNLDPDNLLTKSAQLGYLKGVKKAIALGANIHVDKDQVFYFATISGSLDIVKYLFNKGLNQKHLKYYGIINAAGHGHLELVKFLVEHTSEKDNLDWSYSEAIRSASHSGYTEIVEYLKSKISKRYLDQLTEGLNDYLKGPTDDEIWEQIKDYTPNNILTFSINKGYLKGIKYLHEHGADIHKDHDFLLKKASEEGHLNIVKYLVEHGVDIHIDNEYSLCYSAQFGHLNVVKYCIEHDADIHVDNDFPLRIASEEGHLDIVTYLVEHGANIYSDKNIVFNALKRGRTFVGYYLKSKLEEND